MGLQDIRLDLKDPTIARPKRDIGIGVLVSDFLRSILGRVGRLREGSSMVMIAIFMTVTFMLMAVMFLMAEIMSLIAEVCCSHCKVVVVVDWG